MSFERRFRAVLRRFARRPSDLSNGIVFEKVAKVSARRTVTVQIWEERGRGLENITAVRPCGLTQLQVVIPRKAASMTYRR